MAFFLTPRFAPAYTAQQCNPWACAPRQQHSYRRVIRPAFPSLGSFTPYLNNVDELVSALEQEAHHEAARREAARREAHRQREQRKRIVRAHFNVHENPESYQVDAELPYFQQEHIEIEVTDDNTLKLSGNTERRVEQGTQHSKVNSEPEIVEAAPESESQHEAVDGTTLNESERASTGTSTPAESDTASHKSYQPTVEDDFEDLGAEIASTFSAHFETEAPKEPKGKEKVAEESTSVVQQPKPEVPQPEAQQEQQWEFQGSFERTFRFPLRIDAANVKASFRNGLLSVTIPKSKAPEARKILIQ